MEVLVPGPQSLRDQWLLYTPNIEESLIEIND